MESNALLRSKAATLVDTIFSCFMSAFGRNSVGDQNGISPNLRVHEQAVLLAVMLNIQARINVMSTGNEVSHAYKQAELMQWLLGSEIVLQAVDNDYAGYICDDLVPARAVQAKSLRMMAPSRRVKKSLPAFDITDPRNHEAVLARFIHSDMAQRVREGYAMFNALCSSFAQEKIKLERLLEMVKRPTAKTISLLYYLTHLPMVLSNYGAQTMVKASEYSREHTQLFALLHHFACLLWNPGVDRACPQLRELMLEFGIALTIMSLKRNAGSYGRLTVDPECVPDTALTIRMSNFCRETEIPVVHSENGGVWEFICAYNQVHPISSGRPKAGSWSFTHPYNKCTALHHWMLHGLLSNLRALADTTGMDISPTLFSYKIGNGTSNKMSLDDMIAILSILPGSVEEAIDDDRLLELLEFATSRPVVHERLRVLENMACVAVLRAPRFTRGKNKYWAIERCITLLDLERGMLSMERMRCATQPSGRLTTPRSLEDRGLITSETYNVHVLLSITPIGKGPLWKANSCRETTYAAPVQTPRGYHHVTNLVNSGYNLN